MSTPNEVHARQGDSRLAIVEVVGATKHLFRVRVTTSTGCDYGRRRAAPWCVHHINTEAEEMAANLRRFGYRVEARLHPAK